MIAQFLFKHPRILFLVICVVLVSGMASFLVMPRLEDPVLGRRVGVISIAFPGADSKRVESLVTLKLEEKLRSISQIKQVRSASRTGISNIAVELHDHIYEVEDVWSVVRSKIENSQVDLPEGCLPPKLEVVPLKAFAAIIALKPRQGGVSQFTIVRRLARHLRTELSNIAGTESVNVFGDSGEEFVVDVKPAALAALNLSTAAIAQQLSASNVTQPAGFMRTSQSELVVDLNATFDSISDLERATIQFGTGQTCNLSEIADIRVGSIRPATRLALIDGEESIVIGAFVDDSLRVDQWSQDLDRVLTRFQQRYKADCEVELVFSQSQYISARLETLLWNLLLGTFAVVVVVFLLMGWRSMIVVGTTLPLSALLVMSGMRWLGIPIHQMSVTGLIVALGLLIDNAIVIVEDIRGRIYAGEPANGAIRRSVRHLVMPLLGSTLTTALAFLPIATLPGPPGEFVGTIAVSVILAISASLLLAMTVVPALLSLLRIDSSGQGLATYGVRNRWLKSVYEKSLDWVFRFPLAGVALGAALPVLGYWAVKRLPEQFFPPSDRNQVQIEVELPARATTTETLASVTSMRNQVADHPEVARVHWFIGESAPTFYYNVVPRRRAAPYYAQAIVDLKPGVNTTMLVRDLQKRLDREHGECRVVVRLLEQGPPFDAPIEVRVVGPDLEVLHRLGSELRLALAETPNVIHTRSDFEESVPKLVVAVDSHSAKKAMLNKTEIAQQLYTTLQGARGGMILVGEEEFPVRVKMASRAGSQFGHLGALQIQSARRPLPRNPNTPPLEANPPLSAIAEFGLDADLAAIIRINGQRTNEIKGYLSAGVLPSTVVKEFNRRLEKSGFKLPDGYTMEFGGEKAERTSAVKSLIANAVILFSLMVLTLVVSFRSFRPAAIIILVGGLAIGLGPLALWVFGYPLGFMAIVGTMGLVGVAINDSIVVLAAIRENELAAAGDRNELRKVIVASTRHVLATTLTTVVGFLPLILGGGGFWPPLAISIAGGVGGATFLALYLVPSMNLLLHQSGAMQSSGAIETASAHDGQ